MSEALHKGDYVLVSKWRFRKRLLNRNDIVLLKSPLMQDRRNAPLLLSRCIALPGDTVIVRDDGYTVNGEEYPRSPTTLQTYAITEGISVRFLAILEELGIPHREISDGSSGLCLRLTRFEEYRIREELSPGMNASFVRSASSAYAIVVPLRGVSYHITESLLSAGREAIIQETGGMAVFRNDNLYIKDRRISTISFSQDYYWLLSDNIDEGIDSRHLGLIPRSHIIGKVQLRWYSSPSSGNVRPSE